MDAAVAAFERLIDYEIGEVTAAATYYLAETHIGFSRSLLASERPPGMHGAQLEEYQLALEEEAFPFEEQAIAVHEKNMELRARRHLQRLDRQEPGRLAVLVPVRYAKDRAVERLPRLHERYAYIAPICRRSPLPRSRRPRSPCRRRAVDGQPGIEEVPLAGAH